ncbi:hypothetical protein ACFW9V_19770 [Streptomyces hygroscopicus]|uniref:hypothetical protein n=1 Tax=Streptomyces hygroscopicus TaxID=1912 RepID=UPI0036ABE75A
MNDSENTQNADKAEKAENTEKAQNAENSESAEETRSAGHDTADGSGSAAPPHERHRPWWHWRRLTGSRPRLAVTTGVAGAVIGALIGGAGVAWQTGTGPFADDRACWGPSAGTMWRRCSVASGTSRRPRCPSPAIASATRARRANAV